MIIILVDVLWESKFYLQLVDCIHPRPCDSTLTAWELEMQFFWFPCWDEQSLPRTRSAFVGFAGRSSNPIQ